MAAAVAEVPEIARPGWNFDQQPKAWVEKCNLCGNTQFVTLSHLDRYGFVVNTEFCNTCGLVFLNPLMTRDAYAEFYAEAYRPLVAWWSKKPEMPDRREAGAEFYARYIGRLLARHLPKNPQTLLDIGGDRGTVATMLSKDFGLKATVIDPAIQAGPYTSFRGLLEDFDPKQTFDVVTMCQTVDHLLDLKGGLAKVRKLISPHGVFFVDIVDFASEARRVKHFRGACKVDHPYYLTEHVFENALAQAGFTWELKDYSEDGRHIGYVCKPTFEQRVYFDPSEVRASLKELRRR